MKTVKEICREVITKEALPALSAIAGSRYDAEAMEELGAHVAKYGWDPKVAMEMLPVSFSGPATELLLRAGRLAEWEANRGFDLGDQGWASLALDWRRIARECNNRRRFMAELVAEYGGAL